MKVRTTAPISPRLNDKLNNYVAGSKATANNDRFLSLSTAAAIGAVGLGALGITPISRAELVVTVTNQAIKAFQPVRIDVNKDGVTDISFLASSSVDFSTTFKYFAGIDAKGLNSNQVMMTSQMRFAAA